MGIATFASGAASAYGNYQQGQAANANAISNYEYAIKQREVAWRNDLKVWSAKRKQYAQTLRANNTALNRSYQSEQARLNEQYQAAAFQKQDQLVAMIKQQGLLGERQGVGAGKLSQEVLAQYGRNNATIAANLVSARNAMIMRQQGYRDQAKAANNQAYSNVAVKPRPGVAPPAPNLTNPGLGLATGLLGAAVGGFSAYNSMKPPGGGSPPPGGGMYPPGSGAFDPSMTIPGINYGGIPSNYAMPSGTNWSNTFNYQV